MSFYCNGGGEEGVFHSKLDFTKELEQEQFDKLKLIEVWKDDGPFFPFFASTEPVMSDSCSAHYILTVTVVGGAYCCIFAMI